MGTDPAQPSLKELPLSNWTRFSRRPYRTIAGMRFFERLRHTVSDELCLLGPNRPPGSLKTNSRLFCADDRAVPQLECDPARSLAAVDCRNGSGRDHRGFGAAEPALLRINSGGGDEAH